MKELLSVFKALSDETRLRIVKLPENGELYVCHIVAAVDMSQSKASFHLRVLREAGLVKDRREGKWMHIRNENDVDQRKDIFHARWRGIGSYRTGRNSWRIPASRPAKIRRIGQTPFSSPGNNLQCRQKDRCRSRDQTGHYRNRERIYPLRCGDL